MAENKDLLVIKPNIHLSPRDLRRIRESIMLQKETGLVILPFFCEALVVPKNVEIRVEERYSGREL